MINKLAQEGRVSKNMLYLIWRRFLSFLSERNAAASLFISCVALIVTLYQAYETYIPNPKLKVVFEDFSFTDLGQNGPERSDISINFSQHVVLLNDGNRTLYVDQVKETFIPLSDFPEISESDVNAQASQKVLSRVESYGGAEIFAGQKHHFVMLPPGAVQQFDWGARFTFASQWPTHLTSHGKYGIVFTFLLFDGHGRMRVKYLLVGAFSYNGNLQNPRIEDFQGVTGSTLMRSILD